ncbi:MAG: serine/threonine-protein kinase [Myxococcota bacterium]
MRHSPRDRRRTTPPAASGAATVTKAGSGWNDRYLPTDPLGEGGMSRVWRAWDRERGAWCALMVLKQKYAEQRESRRRFISAGRMLMNLDHRNVIHAYDLLDEDPPCLVMEVADGGSLWDWVERHGPMPPRMAVGVAIQVCKGLGAAHRAGVIHRDMKPHNVLVNRKGVCKVSDFGIARIRREDGSMDVPDATTVSQTTGDAMGTFGYMSPEQRSDPRRADVRTDVYGVGSTLYHLLIGGPNPYLFAAEQNPEVLRDIPEALRPLMLKAVAYRPEDRFKEIRDMSLALFHVRQELPEDPDDTPQLADGLPPEPEPPPGLIATQSDPEPIEGLEDPTSIRLPPDPPRARLQSARPSAPPSPPPPPAELVSLPPPQQERRPPAPASGTSSRSGPRVRSSIERRLSHPVPPSEVDLARPTLVVGTRLWVLALVAIGFGLSALVADMLWVTFAENAALASERRFRSEVTRQDSVVIGAVERLPEVPAAEVRDRFREVAEAHGVLGARVEAARALTDTLEQQVLPVLEQKREEVRQRQLSGAPATAIDKQYSSARQSAALILEQRNAWRAEQEAWLYRTDHFPGSVAVRLGLKVAPPRLLP